MSITKNSCPEVDPRFPSGDWGGFLVLEGTRWPMELQFYFSGGRLKGQGVDEWGPFLLQGTYRTQDGRTSWIKRYIRAHAVQYAGLAEEGRGMQGYWAMETQFGEFQVWPEKHPTARPQKVDQTSRSNAWLVLASVHREKNSIPESDAAITKALAAVDHRDADELNSIAWKMHQIGVGPEAAERLASASLELKSSNPFAAHTLAAILIRERKWEQAWPVLKIWLAHVPESVVEWRWHEYYLPLFQEAVRAGHAGVVAELLKETDRDELWLPLYQALLAAGSNQTGAIAALPEEHQERAASLYRELRATP
jgi:hypothetical protein